MAIGTSATLVFSHQLLNSVDTHTVSAYLPGITWGGQYCGVDLAEAHPTTVISSHRCCVSGYCWLARYSYTTCVTV